MPGKLIVMTTQIRRKVLNQFVALLLIAGFLVLASSTRHKKLKQEESEAELEHKARVWIDALMDRVAEKHAQDKIDLQKSLENGEEILIE